MSLATHCTIRHIAEGHDQGRAPEPMRQVHGDPSQTVGRSLHESRQRVRSRVRSLASVRRLCQVFFLSIALTANAQHMGLVVRDAKSPPGAEVTSVAPGTPAAKAELKAGDVIVQVQGSAVASADQFTRAAHAMPPGSAVMLRVSRQGWQRDVQLQSPPVRLSFGFAVKDSPSGSGAAVATVDTGGPAADAGLAVGDRVIRLEGRAIADASRMQAQIEDAANRGKALALTVERGGWAKEVALAPKPVSPAQPEGTGGPLAASGTQGAAATSSLSAEMDEANRYYEAGNWREAEAAYRRLLQTLPDDPRVWGRLCHVLVMEERFADAIEGCQRATRLAPAEASIFQNIGYSYSRLGNYGEAIASYQKAIDLAPDWPAPYAGTAAAYYTQQNWPKAEEFYRQTVTRDPKSRVAWQALGDAAGEQGKSADAIAHYRKALDLEPANASLMKSLGWHLYRERRYEEAETALLDASRLSPADVTTLVWLGSVQEKLGKIAAARQAWQRAAELDPAGPIGLNARQNLAALAAAASPPVGSPSVGSPVPVEAMGLPPGSSPATRPPAARTETLPPQGGPLKATIAIGDFLVKAVNASQYIGDGLREMLLTALHGTGRFVVLERMDIKGLAAEQVLSRSPMARPSGSIPEGQMEIAEVMIYGSVTEFDPEVSGGGLSLGMPNVPITLGVQSKVAHMAIDVRLVDVASGRVLATGRVVGEARSARTTVDASISARGVKMPVTLGGFQNTPMERAIRECIEKATAYVIGNTPPNYFHHS